MEPVQILSQEGRWRARDVHYWRGTTEALTNLIPEFTRRPFAVPTNDGAENPFFDTIVRLPMTLFEKEIPIGIVSKSYRLLQHREVMSLVLKALRKAGVAPATCTWELGLSQFGEFMELRIGLPREFEYMPNDGKVLRLTFECYNTVEGSARLAAEMCWYRLVCSNGLVVRQSQVYFSDTHDQDLDVEQFAQAIQVGLNRGMADRKVLHNWGVTPVVEAVLVQWVDSVVANLWGVQRAARVLHICRSGHDGEFPKPFAAGKASEKPISNGPIVPGASCPARTLYDVAQALAWVANTLREPEERRNRRSEILRLVTGLARAAP
jgi:hypothetical protein